jgi:molybdenum cofactor cytidylyltransferase
MKLFEALGVARGEIVSFVGGGGKTSALVGLGYEVMELGWRVLASTTTYLDEDQLGLMPAALRFTGDFGALNHALNEHKFVFLYGEVREGRALPPPLDWSALLDNVDSDLLLLEADKAHGRSFKAPLSDEPRIPTVTTLAVPVVALNVLDRPFDDANVYNAAAMSERYGFVPGQRIHAPWVGQVLRDEELGMKHVPPNARVVALLNQTSERGYSRQRARLIARTALKGSRIHGVAIGAVRAATPVYEVQRSLGAVVLAAGLSSRMGEHKMLLPWVDGKTIIESIVEQLIRSRLDHIVVVTGHGADDIRRVLKPLDVPIVHNRQYRSGEMLSSLKVGLQALPESVSSAMVVLGDQPRLEAGVLHKLMKAYAESTRTIAAPSYNRRRGHPILISRQHWPEILDLPLEGSLRDFLNAHQANILYVDVNTDSVLRDVDTPFEYNQERLRAGLETLNLSLRQRDAE